MQIKAYPISNNLYNRINLNFQLDGALKKIRSNLIRTGEKVYFPYELGTRPDIHAYLNSEINGAFIGCTHTESYLKNDKDHVTSIDCHITTLYQCEFCSNTEHPFIADSIGQYLKHIWNNHNMHFLEIAQNEQPIKSVSELFNLKEYEDYNITNPNPDLIRIETDGTNGTETHLEIEVTRDFNEYGVPLYALTIETADWQNEIETSEVSAQHEHDLGEYEEEEELSEEQQQQKEEETIKEIDNNAQTKKQQWLNRKKWNYSTTYRQYLTIESIIKDHYCYVNIPHYHYFKGYKLIFKAQDYQEIKAMLTLYDKLLNLYEANTQ